MNNLFLRSRLWLVVAMAFLFSCQKGETDQIRPDTNATNAGARIGDFGDLYEQKNPDNLYPDKVEVSPGNIWFDDFNVPAGETWHAQYFAFYGDNLLSAPAYDVFIYGDDNGKPSFATPVSSSLTRGAQILNLWGTAARAFRIDIEDTQLPAGRYWVGITAYTGGSFWGTIPLPIVGANAGIKSIGSNALFTLNYNLAFRLEGTAQAATTIGDVITALDGYVSNGTISGAGKGKNPAKNLNTFKAMLDNASLLIAANNLPGACTQLTDAQNRIFPVDKAKPLITGSSTDELHALIAQLKTALGCL